MRLPWRGGRYEGEKARGSGGGESPRWDWARTHAKRTVGEEVDVFVPIVEVGTPVQVWWEDLDARPRQQCHFGWPGTVTKIDEDGGLVTVKHGDDYGGEWDEEDYPFRSIRPVVIGGGEVPGSWAHRAKIIATNEKCDTISISYDNNALAWDDEHDVCSLGVRRHPSIKQTVFVPL